MQGRAPCLRPVAASRRWKLSRTEGGLGTGEAAHRRHRPPPTAEPGPTAPKPDPGRRNDKFGCGVEKPKVKEQPETAARGRSSRRALQGQIATIFAAGTPQGRLQIARGGFFPTVSPIT